VSLKRAALLLSIAYALAAAEHLFWQARAFLDFRWSQYVSVPFNMWWSLIFGTLTGVTWAAYCWLLYRERSQRSTPVSLWAMTLWTAAIATAAPVAAAIQFRVMAASGAAGWTGLPVNSQIVLYYASTALWIALIVLLADDPRGRWTRRVALVLAAVTLLNGSYGSFLMVNSYFRTWNTSVVQAWSHDPLYAFYSTVISPSLGTFHRVCAVLFPYAVWREIEPPATVAETPAEQPAGE
jgi:hypothetical protein